MNLSSELTWRGFVNQTTYKSVTALDADPITFYWGVDPSSNSMQIGNLAAMMMVKHFIDAGHKAVLLVGGATGMIGDPDGKSEERNLKSLEEISTNIAGISAQYSQVLGDGNFKLVNNNDWFKNINYMDFLRDVGKHVPMRQMLAREFVQSRLGEGGAGISYAEFSYSLIQGFDFLYMNREMGVTLQVCGADQWGNSVAGVDLIRRITGNQAHVWSTPLIMNKATGKKFGKTEAGAIWLDPNLTSPYKFYQFWLNVDDEGAGDYLKIYTLLTKHEILDIMKQSNSAPASRAAQKRLAYEVTKIVHGVKAAESQKLIANVLFGSNDPLSLGEQEITALTDELPLALVPQQMTIDDLATALVVTYLASSKGEARRFLSSGAIHINNIQINAVDATEFRFDMQKGFAVIRRGKNTNAILRVQN